VATHPATASSSDIPDRYRDNPLRAVLENYALDIIGKLPADMPAQLTEITKAAWGGSSDWKHALRKQMKWDERTDDEIRENWVDFQAAAKKSGTAPDELAFARAFADHFEKHSH
jgi:hypothetical protein